MIPACRFTRGQGGAVLRLFGHACCLLAGLALGCLEVRAHPGYLTSAVAKVDRNGTATVDLSFDVVAYALNDAPERVPDAAMNEWIEGPEGEIERLLSDARRRFGRNCRVWVDGQLQPATRIEFPETVAILRARATPASHRLPVVGSASVSVTLPRGSSEVAFSFPEIVGNVVLTLERPGVEPVSESLSAGARSRTWAFDLAHSSPAASEPSVSAGVAESRPVPERRGLLAGLGSFVRLGFVHIVPHGLDHVLFVLALFLLGGGVGRLLAQVTAFTLAHSVTLALALYGVVRLPDKLVEPLIAVSILLMAVDNLRGGQMHRWRVAAVFGFGLIHGLGFAGALQETGLPAGEFVRALIGFNVGVELGQLAVIAAAFALVGWIRAAESYRRFVVVPASAAIALVALFWTAERVGVL